MHWQIPFQFGRREEKGVIALGNQST